MRRNAVYAGGYHAKHRTILALWEALRSMTDEIMYELMSLSGQEYVDMYATKAKSMTADAALVLEAPDQSPVPAAAPAA